MESTIAATAGRSPAIDPDRRTRGAAFAAIEKLSRQHGGQIPWQVIRVGFQAGGETVLFASRAKGIFKPRQMSAALSIKTTVPRAIGGSSSFGRCSDSGASGRRLGGTRASRKPHPRERSTLQSNVGSRSSELEETVLLPPGNELL